jgi:DNA-binding transcriptional ArsR family regulator
MSAARHEPRLARVAAVIGDAARSRMLALLLDGHYATAGELASAATVSAPTASGHLRKLVDAGLVVTEARGRHRYFKLADADVAHALEALALVAERGTHERRWAAPERVALRHARCCYGHLAGELGVALKDALVRHGFLVVQADNADTAVGSAGANGYVLTDAGRAWLASLDIELPAARRGQRLAYPCLDWSERRDHLAGALAVTLLEAFVERAWLRKRPTGTGERHRALELTPRGRQKLWPLLAAA